MLDRSKELPEWAEVLATVKVPIYACANNHDSGYGADTVEMFLSLWRGPTIEQVKPTVRVTGPGKRV